MTNLSPLLSSGRKTANSLIVEVLGKEFPLTAKQVFNKVVKANPAVKLTYQAIHKALKQLESDKIALKGERGFKLSPDWIKSVQRFAGNMVWAYSVVKDAYFPDIPLNQSVSVEFDSSSMMAAPYFWLLEKMVETKQVETQAPNPCIWQYNAWPLTVLSEDKYAKFKELFAKSRGKVACFQDLACDRVLLKLWEPFGFEVRTGVPLPSDCELMCFWEYSFQIFRPKTAWKAWHEEYKKIDASNLQDFSFTHKMAYEMTSPATVVITRNQLFADNIRSQINQYFK